MIILPPMPCGGSPLKPRHILSAFLAAVLVFWLMLCVARWLEPPFGHEPQTLLQIILSDLKYLSTKRIW